MSAHWDWAIHQALALPEFTHFAYVTDRMIVRAEQLPLLAAIVAAYPNAIVAYSHDRIVDNSRPVWLEEYAWTGHLLEISASHLLYLTSQAILPVTLPRMLNCIAPRTIINSVEARFGNVFGSTAPDYNFCSRCLEQVDSILFYDKAVLVHYALDRSNGASLATGRASSDHRDFLKNLGSTPLNFAAPYPEVWSTNNTIFHEYNVVRNETLSAKFPPLDLAKYISHLSREIEAIQNHRVKRRMRARLRLRQLPAFPVPEDKPTSFWSWAMWFSQTGDALTFALKRRY